MPVGCGEAVSVKNGVLDGTSKAISVGSVTTGEAVGGSVGATVGVTRGIPSDAQAVASNANKIRLVTKRDRLMKCSLCG